MKIKFKLKTTKFHCCSLCTYSWLMGWLSCWLVYLSCRTLILKDQHYTFFKPTSCHGNLICWCQLLLLPVYLCLFLEIWVFSYLFEYQRYSPTAHSMPSEANVSGICSSCLTGNRNAAAHPIAILSCGYCSCSYGSRYFVYIIDR